MTTYPLYEYLLVLNPHEELRNRITKVKQHLLDHYLMTNGLFAGSVMVLPTVALASFQQYELVEQRLVNRLNLLAMGYHPMKITLNNFGSFPTHSIYINIGSKLPVQQLVRQIRNDTQKILKVNDDHRPYFMTDPHLTLAWRIPADKYEKIWHEYRQKHFSGSFIADAMLLLKRRIGEKKYQVLQRFEFQNLPVTTKQGALFL